MTSTTPPPEKCAPSQEMIHTPSRASYATDGSLTEKNGPGCIASRLVPGRKPWVQDTPPSLLVAQPISVAPPLKTRPVWNAETKVEPNANVSGSTSVACSPVGAVAGVYGSALTCVTPCCAASAGGAVANAEASAAASSAAAHHAVRGNRSRGSAPAAAERAARVSMCMDMTLLAGWLRTLAWVKVLRPWLRSLHGVVAAEPVGALCH